MPYICLAIDFHIITRKKLKKEHIEKYCLDFQIKFGNSKSELKTID